MFKSWKSLFVRGTAGSKGSARTVQPKKKTRRASLSLEALEDRWMPATLIVTNTLDDFSAGTLRLAVNQANRDGAQGVGDTIEFQTGVDATHILLQQGRLELTAGAKVSIWGTGSFGAKMVLNGDGGNIFQVDQGAWLDLHELTLAGGTANAFVGPNGGAINNAGTLSLSLCNFVNNSATCQGGAIYNTGTVSVLYASTFTGNSAQQDGGAVYNAAAGTASLLGTFSGNSAGVGAGGAIYNDGVMTVAVSTLSGNTSARDNGGAVYNDGVMTVATSALSGNTAQNNGGAILNRSHGTMTVSTSTLANNSANTGGAISNLGALTLSAATVVGNTAANGAGGIATLSPLTLVDTIVAGNTLTGTSGAGPDVDGSATTFSAYNLIGDGTGLSGISNGINNNQIGSSSAPLKPLLFPLGNYGGPTQTMPPQPGSPALGAGSRVTTLTAAIGTQDTVIPVGYAAAIASNPSYDGTVQIDGEVMSVTIVDLNNNTLTVVRASVPKHSTSHSMGAGVYFENDQSFTPILPGAVAVGAAQSTTGPAAKFSVTGPTPFGEISGVGFTVTITAEDGSGNTVTQYNGPVTLKCSDGLAYPVVQVTNGVGTAVIGVDKAATGDRLTATDGSISGTSDPFDVHAGPATNLKITAPPSATAGLGFNATIAGTDWFGNPASGLVTVASSDGEAVADVVLSNGQALDPITLDIAGPDKLTASTSAATSSTNLTVNPGDAVKLAVSVSGPSTVTAGDHVTLTVSRLDAFGNLANTGLIETTLSCSDSQVASFVPVTFGNHGTATLQFKLVKAEAVTFTASWSAPLPIGPPTTSTSNVVTVNPGGALKFIVGAGATQLAGTPFNVSITPEDFYNNVTAYSGQLTLTSNDGQQVVGGANVNGQGFGNTDVAVTLNDPGAVILTANANGELLFGKSLTITVDAVINNKTNIWSGYVTSPGSGVTAVGGSWVQPAVTGDTTGQAAFWVGIDGLSSNTVEQCGTWAQFVGGKPQYNAWYEFYGDQQSSSPFLKGPDYNAQPLPASFVVNPGDTISAEVSLVAGTSNTFLFQITDQPQNGGPVESWSLAQTTAYVTTPQLANAEWIVEDPNTPSPPLANFGQVNFTGAWATTGSTTGSINSYSTVSALNDNTSLAQDYASNPPVSSNTLGYNEPASGVSSSSFTVTYGVAPPSGGAVGPATPPDASAATRVPGGAVMAQSSIGDALAFSAPAYSFDEKAGTVTLTINRTSGTDGTAAVHYDVSAATGLKTKYQAVPNADFTGTMDGIVTFNPGETQKTVTFAMTADNLVEENKSFVVTLSNPTGGASLGSQVSTTVTIVDDHLPVVPNATPHLATLQKAGIGFGTSDEHYQQFVRSAYDHYLRRTPSDAELKYWVDQMKVYETDHTKGLKQEQIEAGFIDSKEYIGRFGTVGKAWIDGIYQDLLARAPDASGESYWVGQLNAGMDPTRVALGFTTSLERLQNRVSATYQSLLERAPDADGLKYWVNIFNSGGTTEDINSGFVGSAEYYNKADGAAGNPDRWVREAYLDILFRSAQVSEMTYWSNFLNG